MTFPIQIVKVHLQNLLRVVHPPRVSQNINQVCLGRIKVRIVKILKPNEAVVPLRLDHLLKGLGVKGVEGERVEGVEGVDGEWVE